MRNQTCCFTGHRQIESPLREKLKIAVLEAIRDGYRYFGTGGALGFDTLAAQTVLELKESYPHIRLILVLPCRNQTRGWQKSDIAEYERVKQAADKVVCLSETYYSGCMHKRNRHLVDHSSLCICYQTKPTGGTAYTVNYAKQNGLTIRNLAEK